MELSGAGAPTGAVACPVCTLYLREGISLQKHLDTHPKEQVIEALIKASASSLQTHQQQQQLQPQNVPVSATTAISASLQSQTVPQVSTSLQTPQVSPQVTQNTHISTHSPYPIGPIFECPPVGMMPPQFTSFNYQQFVNNGTMMIPQYAMAPQANQMMQMLYNPYGLYQQQQIPTVQMISPVAAVPGQTRIRPVVTMAAESNARTTLTVHVNSPEPKQILPEILPENEPEPGPIVPDVSLPASPSVLQNEDTSVRREENDNNPLEIERRGQQTPTGSTLPGENTVQREFNAISTRSITIARSIDNADEDKVESVLPDIVDEEPSEILPVDLQHNQSNQNNCIFEQSETQQVLEKEYANVSEKKNESADADSMVCEHESEMVSSDRPVSRSSGVNSNIALSRDPVIEALKESAQPELNPVERLESLITIMERDLNNASLQKESDAQNNQEERLSGVKETLLANREESVIHDTVVTIPGSHEKDHILPDIQEDNNTWCPNDYVDDELRTLEKTCRYLSYNAECSTRVDDQLDSRPKTPTTEKSHLYKYKHSFSAPASPVAGTKSCKATRRYSTRSELGSCENLSAWHHPSGFDNPAIVREEDEDEDEDEDTTDDENEREKIDEDNFDEADMEIEEIPSPHTPFVKYGENESSARSHTPLSTISGISVLRVRKDLSKPCSPTSINSFHQMMEDSDSESHDEDSNIVDNNVVDKAVDKAAKDPIDCSPVEEKIKTDHQQQASAHTTVCQNVEKIQESSSSYTYHHHQSVITEHISSFPTIHSQQSVLMHESFSMTTNTKTQSLLSLPEAINPTTSADPKSFHSTKSLMQKQSMELLNINEDAHAGPMNVFEFDGLQILVPSTFISDSSQKAVSATSQQSMTSSEGAIGVDEEVKSINMRADETMPPRGELSEQESNGCTEQSTWQVCIYIIVRACVCACTHTHTGT